MKIILSATLLVLIILIILLLNFLPWRLRKLKNKLKTLQKKVPQDIRYAEGVDIAIQNTESWKEAFNKGNEGKPAVASAFKESRLIMLEDYQDELLELARLTDLAPTAFWPKKCTKELEQLRKETKEFINQIVASF